MSAKEFFDKFKFISNSFKENIAVNYVSDVRESLGITYFELNRVSDELSSYFEKIFGKDSQYIGVSLNDYLFLPCIILGIWKSRNFFAGAGNQYAKNHTVYFLNFLQVVFLITDNENDEYQGDLVSSFHIHNRMFFIWKRRKQLEFKNPKDICYGIMTSGSTGEPKIIQVPWSCILSNAIELSHEFDVKDFDCVFQASPYSFDPFFIELLITFLSGCTLMIVSNSIKLSSSLLLKTLFGDLAENQKRTIFECGHKNYFYVDLKHVKKKSVTVLQMTPSLLRRWSDNEIQNIILSPQSKLKVLVLGGEKFPSEILKLRSPNNSTKIYNIYGITEISCWAFLNNVTNLSHISKISLGKPLENIVYKISENGEFCIGSKIRICYINDEKFFQSKEPVFRKTGDVVEYFDNEIYYCGRSNEIVKKFGIKINLSKIEDLFKVKNKSIKEAYCVYDDENLILSLFYMPLKTVNDGTKYNIVTYQDFSKKNYTIPTEDLKDIEKPDCLVEISSIPVNSHGKCDKRKLLQILKDLIKTEKPVMDLKNIFSELWVKALNINKVGLFTRSFTELGGNSVLGLEIVSGLEDKGVHVPQTFIGDLLGGKNYEECLETLHLSLDELGNPKKRIKLMEANDVKLSIRWKFDLGKCIDATPTVFSFQGEERIIVGSHSSKLSCLNSDSGQEIWTINLGDRIESGFRLTKDRRMGFIGCYDHFVYCIASSDGTIIWKYKTNDMIKSTPCLSSDEKILYVSSYDKHIYCLRTHDGLLVNSLKPSDGGIYSSGIVNDTLNGFYIGTLNSTCVAINQETNQINWTTVLESPVFASPCFIPERTEILFSEVLGIIHCLNATTGEKMWNYKADGNIYSSPVVETVDNVHYIIFGCHDANLYCLQYEREPILKWRQQLDSAVFAKPSIALERKFVCAATAKGLVYLCDFNSGSIVTYVKLDWEVFSSPIYSNSRLYVGCRDNNVYALDISKQ